MSLWSSNVSLQKTVSLISLNVDMGDRVTLAGSFFHTMTLCLHTVDAVGTWCDKLRP